MALKDIFKVFQQKFKQTHIKVFQKGFFGAQQLFLTKSFDVNKTENLKFPQKNFTFSSLYNN